MSDGGTRFPRLGLRLAVWTCLGLGFTIDYVIAAFRDDWIGCVASLPIVLVSIFMLGTGLWMRWPRV